MPEIITLKKCPPWCVDHAGGEHASEALGFSRREGSGVFIARADGQPPRLVLSAGETPADEVNVDDVTPAEIQTLAECLTALSIRMGERK
jgi:hypothetical protein